MKTNPFAITLSQWQSILTRRKQEQRAEQDLRKHLQTYQELTANPAYRAILDENTRLLIGRLDALITQAATCAHCSPIAQQVLVLKDLVPGPKQAVIYATYQERLMDRLREDETADV